MYTVVNYGGMISDSGRMDAYARAIELVVRPGSVVLDIGAGTGIASFLACKFGARKVYAVEPSDAIEVGREIAAANGLADRIEFIQDLSTRIELPEKADVVVSDLRGVMPLFTHHIPSIIDARKRHLKAGGSQIPQMDTLWAAVVESPEQYMRQTGPWTEAPYGFDMSSGLPLVVNSWRKGRVKPEAFLCEAARLGSIDYRSVEDSNFRGSAACKVSRTGTGHGLTVWFDAALAEGIGFSNAPGRPELIYGNAFFPWERPVEIEAGDEIGIEVRANLVGEDYVWEWNTRVEGGGGVKASFRQSTFFASPISLAQLKKRSTGFVPKSGEEGEIDGFVLSLMKGELSLGEIAEHVEQRYPRRFARVGSALGRVSDLAQKYC